jgi:N6-L-threonylcarbamoyladenine synthase
MIILGVETSCDETSAAVISENEVLSSIISSQQIHTEFGGVVPEIASREHIRLLLPIIQQALQEAHLEKSDLNALAVTYGPGLVGALLVGVNFIKGLACALDIPFIGVNHIEGHIYGNLITHPGTTFPVLFLIVSGGHTQLVLMKAHADYEIIGSTRDDAVGEAFDKAAKMLGLGYPGGPEIDRLSQKGNPDFVRFPRATLNKTPFDFSYSGLKTALLTYIQDKETDFLDVHMPDICASYQKAAIEVLVHKTVSAAKQLQIHQVGIAGGVAANSLLRSWLADECATNDIAILIPELTYCTDNAAMIARAGLEYIKRNTNSKQNLNAYPSLKLSMNF